MAGLSSHDYDLVQQFNSDHLWSVALVEHTPLYVMRTLNNQDKHRTLTRAAETEPGTARRMTAREC